MYMCVSVLWHVCGGLNPHLRPYVYSRLAGCRTSRNLPVSASHHWAGALDWQTLYCVGSCVGSEDPIWLLMLSRKISVTTELSIPVPLTSGSCNLSDVNHTEALGNGTQGLTSVTRCSASRLA